ncbi:MAG: DUF4129 domain-containing protein [Gemmatimonadaceae bacterium]
MIVDRLFQDASPWTAAQVHDTVAKIASDPAYGPGNRVSLISRLFRFLFEKFVELLKFLNGTVDARVFLYAVLAIVGGLIVARLVVAQRLAEGSGGGRSRSGARLDGRADYWRMSLAAAASGQYGEASHFAYAAVIDDLSGRGLIKYHSSKTSGDYARDLRRTAPPLHADFRAFARQFDRVIFRESTVGVRDYEAIRDAAVRIMATRGAGVAA